MHGINSGSPSLPPGGFDIEIEAELSQLLICDISQSPDDASMQTVQLEERLQLVFTKCIQVGVEPKARGPFERPVDERIGRLTHAIGQSSSAGARNKKIKGTQPPAKLSQNVNRAVPLDQLGELGRDIALRSGQEIKVSDQSKLGQYLTSKNITNYRSQSGCMVVVVADSTFRDALSQAFTKMQELLDYDDGPSEVEAQSAVANSDADEDDRDVDNSRRNTGVRTAAGEDSAVTDAGERAQREKAIAEANQGAQELEELRAMADQEAKRYDDDKQSHIDSLAERRRDKEVREEAIKDEFRTNEK